MTTDRRHSRLRLRPRYHDPDWWLFAIMLTLVMFGTVMIFSSTSGMVIDTDGEANSFLIRQLAYVAVGLVGLVVAMNFDYHRFRHLALPAILVVAVLLTAVLFVSPDINGARRWFDLGPVHLQPSEIAKPALIIYLAGWLCTKGARVRTFSYGLIQFSLIMGVVVGLVILEPDLGTSILLTTIGIAMFFVAGAHLVQFTGLLMAGGAAFLMLALSAQYRRERLLAFLNPESDLQHNGWHLLQARLALGEGGLFGVGLGASRQKFSWLPAPHNDAIFAVIGEELGLLGGVCVLILFSALGYRGYRVARRAPDQFGMLVAVGITTWIIFQAVFNMGGVTAAIPFTGITLPFISYGGSSLIVTMTAVGIVLNISRQSVTYPASAQARHEPAAVAVPSGQWQPDGSVHAGHGGEPDEPDAVSEERFHHRRVPRYSRR